MSKANGVALLEEAKNKPEPESGVVPEQSDVKSPETLEAEEKAKADEKEKANQILLKAKAYEIIRAMSQETSRHQTLMSQLQTRLTQIEQQITDL